MTRFVAGSRARRVVQGVLTGVAFIVVVVILMMWLAGVFHPKVEDSLPISEPGRAERPVGDAVLVEVRTVRLPRTESAVGTIRAVHETAVASKLLAKVVEVGVIAGQQVKEGDVLVRLDDADLKARLDQAEAAADRARADRDQARIELSRVEQLHEQKAAADIELDRARSTLKAAEAELERAENAAQEAQTVLAYATIRSPLTGVVVDKRVDVGDTVTPGQVLLTLYDPERMQLVASVRESLAYRLKVGQTIDVGVEALGKRCQGHISEIVPQAESTSRSFLVKVTGPCPEGIYSGMFGRLHIPLDEEEVVVVPAAAVRRIGQLDVVDVVEDGALRRRAVQLGRHVGEYREVLSGLRAGEQVVALEPREAAREQG
ncbi:MAG: efflux RND transporter periplasmic adaptor subunit [Phycisphaerales bacterium]|nr:MAG: efflux RND transporter periplasmic adaptor subunit [Phycisphaerales bacterium]